ncbi:hypothetical protein BDA99DRAFT_536023 [Phascolomyces articulosus]|uniref:Uncharacterized protein n=1 Tax=Phascolomyces articulosus TaxID=60185 RepID=A0AAD5PF91_9FUNG|nr:hypothetical protein BDA99DRAFT_536023 [Phascolomyces articulosus]
MNHYQQQQPYWISPQQQSFHRTPITHSSSHYQHHQHHRPKQSINQNKQSRPVSMGPVTMIPNQGYYYYGNNNVAPQHHQKQQQVYQYYYGVPVVSQQPPSSPHHHYAPPSPRTTNRHVDHFRRRSMDELPKKYTTVTTTARIVPHRKISLDIIPTYHDRAASFEQNNSPGLHHYPSADGLPRATLSVSSSSQQQQHNRLQQVSSSILPHTTQHYSYQQKQQRQQSNISQNHSNLTRSLSVSSRKTSSSNYRDGMGAPQTKHLLHRRYSSSEGLRGNRVNEGLARKVMPFQMASIAEERRNSSTLEEDEEVPLAMLTSTNTTVNKQQYNTIPAMEQRSSVKQQNQQCLSIKMSSRCNSTSTASSSSRPSFISKYSNSSGESVITSNCSSIHQQSKSPHHSSTSAAVASTHDDNAAVAANVSPPKVQEQQQKSSRQQRGRKLTVTKRLFSSMHRLSRAVLISPASSNVKSGVKK